MSLNDFAAVSDRVRDLMRLAATCPVCGMHPPYHRTGCPLDKASARTYNIIMKSHLMFLLVALLSLAGCSAMGPSGPQFSIDPAFTAEQRAAISDAVDEWNLQLGLRMTTQVGPCDDCLRIVRTDALPPTQNRLGLTHLNTRYTDRDFIELAGAGTMRNGHTVSEYDFKSAAMHELGHELAGPDFKGCDGLGHIDCTDEVDGVKGQGPDVMAAHATPGFVKQLTEMDIDTVRKARGE